MSGGLAPPAACRPCGGDRGDAWIASHRGASAGSAAGPRPGRLRLGGPAAPLGTRRALPCGTACVGRSPAPAARTRVPGAGAARSPPHWLDRRLRGLAGATAASRHRGGSASAGLRRRGCRMRGAVRRRRSRLRHRRRSRGVAVGTPPELGWRSAAAAAGACGAGQQATRSARKPSALQHIPELAGGAAEDRHHLRRRPEPAVAGRALGRRARVGRVGPPGQQRPDQIGEPLQHVDAHRARPADVEPGDADRTLRAPPCRPTSEVRPGRGGSGMAARSRPCVGAVLQRPQARAPARPTAGFSRAGK